MIFKRLFCWQQRLTSLDSFVCTQLRSAFNKFPDFFRVGI